jgi:hypothetical protein
MPKVSEAMPYLRHLVGSFSEWQAGFDPRSGHVEFVLGKVALQQVISKYFSFSYQFSFHQLLYIH